MEDRQIPMLIRSSVHYDNTEDVVARFCKEVRAL